MAFVFYAHSGIRYLVFLAAFAALAYLLAGMVRGIEFDKLARILTAAYTGLLDLQVLLGIILWLLISSYPALLGHVVMMLGAATAAHMGSILNKRRETPSWGVALAGVLADPRVGDPHISRPGIRPSGHPAADRL